MFDETDDVAAKPRRRQLDSEGDVTQTLLNSLTLEQIREAVYRLAPTKKIALRAHANSLEALLATSASSDEIVSTLLDVERTYPFKHCLLLRMEFDASKVKMPLVGEIYRSGGFEFKVSHAATSPTPTYTFEHLVEFKEWVEVEKDHRVRRTVITRHPIVARFQADRNLLTLSYPGFTHSNAPGSGANGYEKVVESLLQILSRDSGFRLTTLPIKTALKYFVGGANRRVLQVKADVDTPLARLDVSAKGQANDIEEALAAFISAHLPGVEKTALVEASKKAFSSAIPNSIVLYWINEGLFTRLRFWETGTELHFVWNNEAASYRLVDEITSTLSEASKAVVGPSGTGESVLSWVSKQASYTIITPGEVSSHFQLEPGEARTSLLMAMKTGLLEPVYRLVCTEILEEIPNDWSSDPSVFKRLLITVTGIQIDGGKPENLEVAFRRVAHTKERAQ
nr:hypothetical protein [uncultured Roseateles sp.]